MPIKYRTASVCLLVFGLGFSLLVSCDSRGGGRVIAEPEPTAAQSPRVAATSVAEEVLAKRAKFDPAAPPNQLLNQRRIALAKALAKPARLLIGLGTTDVKDVTAQALKPDIFDQYLNGVGTNSWINWNRPTGAYVQKVANDAASVGAVPMFTLYQMAALGDGNMAVLHDPSFMRLYWDNVRILFTQLKATGKPALVNLEPDFWGYTQRVSRDPTQQFAHVTTNNADCAGLSNDVVGVGRCLVKMARTYAPQAYVGFPPSNFGDLLSTELNYMKLIGAGDADFVVMQTLDRDVGCIEAKHAAAGCNRSFPGLTLWDESNRTSPNFREHFAYARTYADSFQRPLIWWQTPLGVASNTPGGTVNAWRDNRVHYFLTHAKEMVEAGGLGVVFSPGQTDQTNIKTDGEQFKKLSASYLAAPAALP